MKRYWIGWAVLCLVVVGVVTSALAGGTERVSLSSSGERGNGGSGGPAISADGRFVAFQSRATNLVADDTNGVEDVFCRDRQLGTTERVSVNSQNEQTTSGDSFDSAISADGRWVVFILKRETAGDSRRVRLKAKP